MFSKAAKIAARIRQGIADPSGMHYDHITPKSKGGTDDVINCQLLLPEVNLKKGAKDYKPRKWQEKFLREWEQGLTDRFLLIAIPGAGKTKAALCAANRFLQIDPADRNVVIVAPNLNVRRQWRDDAWEIGIDLQTEDFLAVPRKEFNGGVITYQAMSMEVQGFRSVVSHKTLVIFDEVHHLGDQKAWGEAAKCGCERAGKMLLLSGTPFRTDGGEIPFVKYDRDGLCEHNFKYDYPLALNDKVVREFEFVIDRGSAIQRVDGIEETIEFHPEMSDEEAKGKLAILLHDRGSFIQEQIRRCHERLQAIRRVVPDAAALAICKDQRHAKAIASVIHNITGCRPSVIVSDEDKANDTVHSFRQANSQWLVSVQMVSEGTDIPRLHALCWLTDVTTELFFRQAIGRISRVRENHDAAEPDKEDQQERLDMDLKAWVFMPADPRLTRHSDNIEQYQQAAKKESEASARRLAEDHQREGPIREFVSSQSDGLHGIRVRANKTYIGKQAEDYQMFLNAGLTPKAAEIATDALHRGFSDATGSESEPKEVRMKRLRADCSNAVNSLAGLVKRKLPQLDLGKIIAKIHALYTPGQEWMGEDQLIAKLDDVNRRKINFNLADYV